MNRLSNPRRAFNTGSSTHNEIRFQKGVFQEENFDNVAILPNV